ncbi:MAG: hypothetical protein IT561_24260 [Alphaproteobacteria bacterium]|nr:hypothetical protein [Alphaproteobacteria bacterium]
MSVFQPRQPRGDHRALALAEVPAVQIEADDDTLRKLADRIQARAVRRCGELLRQFDGQGARTDKLGEGVHTKLTQRQVASDAGLSRHQQVTAVRVANVPAETVRRRASIWRFPPDGNAAHGMRRTNQDKRRAVMALLDDPEWAAWSDGEISRRCAVSQPFVGKLRPAITQNVLSEPRSFVTRHGTVSTISQPLGDARTVSRGRHQPSLRKSAVSLAPAAPSRELPQTDAPRTVSRGGATYTMNTAAIGARPAALRSSAQ